jgi:outer membrane protein
MIKSVIAGLAASVLLIGPALAQNVKIAVVNIQIVLAESPQAQDARQKLQDEFAPRERELIAMQTAFEEKVANLQKDAEVMSSDERAAAERDLGNEQRAIVRKQNELREDADLRQKELIGPVQQAVIAEIQTYADKQGYDIVLAEGIVYANSSVDITSQVLEQLKAGN